MFQVKVGVINVLGSGIFPDAEVVCHLIVAMSDARHRCADDNSINEWNINQESKIMMFYFASAFRRLLTRRSDE